MLTNTNFLISVLPAYLHIKLRSFENRNQPTINQKSSFGFLLPFFDIHIPCFAVTTMVCNAYPLGKPTTRFLEHHNTAFSQQPTNEPNQYRRAIRAKPIAAILSSRQGLTLRF